MESLVFWLTIFIIYSIFYIFLCVHKPKIYSKNPEVTAFGSKFVFPMFIMPSGVMNSIIQLFRKVEVNKKNITKTTKIIKVDTDAFVLLDIYEPTSNHQCIKRTGYIPKFPIISIFMVFRLSKILSSKAVILTARVIRRIGGDKLDRIKLRLRLVKTKLIRLFKVAAITFIILDLKKTLNKNLTSKILKNKTYCKLRDMKRKIKETKLNSVIGVEDIIDPANNHNINDKRQHNMGLTVPDQLVRDSVMLFHGLNGTSNSTYIKGMANVFLDRGCRVFCFNARGAVLPPTTNVFSHIGMTADVDIVVNYVLDNYLGQLSLVGFSMGANWVGKFLGDRNDLKRIKIGVGVCCPFDFASLNTRFKKGLFKRMCYYGMINNYKRYLKRSLVAPIDLSRCNDLEEIDKMLLEDVYKCKSLDEHYKNSSCIHNLDKINIPTLFLSSIDDPIIPKAIVPVFLANKNPHLSFVLTKGGHLGFFNNGDKTFAEDIVGQFYDLYSS